MAVSPIVWFTLVINLANAVAAVSDAARAKLELKRVREAANDASDNGRFSISESEMRFADEMVISPVLLQEFVDDIEKAQRRFAQAINDPGFTIADIEREEQRAQQVICEHIKQVQKLNDGLLPGSELRRVAVSFRCFTT